MAEINLGGEMVFLWQGKKTPFVKITPLAAQGQVNEGVRTIRGTDR